MKKQAILAFIFVFAFSFVHDSAQAQGEVLNLQGYNKQPYHFGFILGMNTMNFSVKPIDNVGQHKWNKDQVPDLPNADFYRVLAVTVSASPGFSVGILGNLRIMRYLDLRFIPTLSFGSRRLDYGIRAIGLVGTLAGSDSSFVVHKKVNSTYITFPLLLKYRSWRKGNYGAYFIGGINYAIDLAAIKKTKRGTVPGAIKLIPHDVGVEIGAGFDFYNTYFKLGIEAKMIYGLKNLVVNDNTIYSESISQLHSKVFMLSFTFE
ncbi:MAG: hypothetical protein IEMM0006_1311 [bacterium]|nr:MAG: hypothetical protein IEMM0006_1311 [bacterium]